MLSLLYVSVSLITRSAEGREVDEIVRSAIDHNLRVGITGALVLVDGRFAQVLEGPRGEVATLMGRIAIDPRHTSVRVVSTSFASERLFPNWGMVQVRDLPQYADLTHIALTAAEAPVGAAMALQQLLRQSATARF